MSVIRINKTTDYVVMSKEHFKEKNMSLKAKGLLSEMLSLPDNWEYSISGLVAINKENETSIKSTLEELKGFGYLKITKLLPNETKTGRIEYIYDIFENPKQEGEKQGVENLGVEFLGVENQVQYNNNKLNNNNKNIYNKFKKPTIEEIEQYCKERNNNINAKTFYDYYEINGWKDREGKQIKNWKQKLITWEGRNKKEDKLPTWWNDNYKKNTNNLDELNKILEEF